VKKDANELLAIVVSDLSQAEIYKSNLENAKGHISTVPLQFTNKDDKQMVFIFEIPQNLNLFTKISEKNSFSQPREIISLGNQLLSQIKENNDKIIMSDITSRNIFIDENQKPLFLFLGSSSNNTSTVQEKAYALGLLMYTISQRKEPFNAELSELSQKTLETPLYFNKETPQDVVDLIGASMGLASSETSYDSIYDQFLEKLKQPKLDLLNFDQSFIAASNSFSQSTVNSEPISMFIVYLYMFSFLVGSGIFCGMKKPLADQQERQPIIPLMQGLDQAERRIEAMQEMQENPNQNANQNVNQNAPANPLINV
jgi:hypothetical protein